MKEKRNRRRYCKILLKRIDKETGFGESKLKKIEKNMLKINNK